MSSSIANSTTYQPGPYSATATGTPSGSAAQLFNASGAQGANVFPASILKAGESLPQHKLMYSRNRTHALYLASDDNLMLFNTSSPHFNPLNPEGSTAAAIWSTGNGGQSKDKQGGYLKFHENGRLVRYDRHDNSFFTMGTENANSPFYYLAVDENTDGLIARDGLDGSVLWVMDKNLNMTKKNDPTVIADYFTTNLGTTLTSGQSMATSTGEYIESADKSHRYFLTHSGELAAYELETGKVEIILSSGIENGRLHVGRDGSVWVEGNKKFFITEPTDGVDRETFALQGEGEVLFLQDTETGDILWNSRRGVIQAPMRNDDIDFDSVFDGVNTGVTIAQIQEEASVETAGLMFHTLRSTMTDLPALTASSTFEYVSEQILGKSLLISQEQWQQFENHNLFNGRLTGHINADALISADGPDKETLEKLIRVSALIFTGLQNYHQDPQSQGDFVWSGEDGEAKPAYDFFMRSLLNDALGKNTTDFLISRVTSDTVDTLSDSVIETFDRNKDGVLDDTEIHTYNFRNHSFSSMSLLNPGDGLVDHDQFARSIKDHVMEALSLDLVEGMDWDGPSRADFDSSSLVEDYPIEFVTFAMEENDEAVFKQMYATPAQMQTLLDDQEDGKLVITHRETLGHHSNKQHWFKVIQLKYEADRKAIYNRKGQLESGYSVQDLFSHYFAAVHKNAVDKGALNSESYRAFKKEKWEYSEDTDTWVRVDVFDNDVKGSKLRDFIDHLSIKPEDTLTTFTDQEAREYTNKALNISEAEAAFGIVAIHSKVSPYRLSTLATAANWAMATHDKSDHPEFHDHPNKSRIQVAKANLRHTFGLLKDDYVAKGRSTDQLQQEFDDIMHKLDHQRGKEIVYEKLELAAFIVAVASIVLQFSSFAGAGLSATTGVIEYSLLTTSEASADAVDALTVGYLPLATSEEAAVTIDTTVPGLEFAEDTMVSSLSARGVAYAYDTALSKAVRNMSYMAGALLKSNIAKTVLAATALGGGVLAGDPSGGGDPSAPPPQLPPLGDEMNPIP
ncbi:MAG: hypothetical protein AAFZ92_01065, partial [Pseudomonadota bacterium]